MTTAHRVHEGLRLPLPGGHQRRNALLAVAAADLLDSMGWEIPAEAVREGLASTRWPGRFQILEGRPRTILDGAHNPAACAALARALEQAEIRPEATTLLLGILRDKDTGPMLDALLPRAARVVVTRGFSGRFRDPWSLAAPVRERTGQVEVTATLEEGLARAREVTPPDGTICVTGSLYLVGDLMAHLGLRPFHGGAKPVKSTG